MDIATTQILSGLGWAVIHSLWQGALAATAVFMFRAMTKDSQASLRCCTEIIALMACFAAFIATFSLQVFAPTSGAGAIPSLSDLIATQAAIITSNPGDFVGAALPIRDPASLAPIFGMLWCIGFILLAARYAYGFAMTHKLRTQGLSPAPANWDSRFKTLILNAGIMRRVTLHISSRVNGPMTLGFFRPVVLVPASFFSGLPASQIEAILLHEIAHIRRHDYLINLFQTAIKTVLFYHPAVHFISKCIDDDREQACDDFAVGCTKNPAALAKGLAALRLNLAPQNFALAAARERNPLLRRLTRLMAPEESRRRPEQVVTSLAVLAVAAGLYNIASPISASAHPLPEDQPPAPRVESWAKPAPAAPSADAKLAGAPEMAPGIYIDGKRFEPENWSEKDESKIEALTEAFETKMELVEADFEDALEEFENAADIYGEHPQEKSKHFEEAQAKFAEAVLEANTKRDVLSETFDAQISQFVDRKTDAIVDREVSRAVAKAQIDVNHAQQQARRDIAQAKRDAEQIKREAMHEAAEAKREAQQDAWEAEHEAEQSKREAMLEAAEAKREAQQAKWEAKREAELDKREAEHEAKYGDMARRDLQTYGRTFITMLRADGIIDQRSDTAEVTYKNGNMYVNGKEITGKTEDGYCALNQQFGIKKSDHMSIKISPQNITITDDTH